MADVIDFPKSTNKKTQELIEAIAKSDEFKACLEVFEEMKGFERLNKRQIAGGFYLHGFMDALKTGD